MYFPTAFKGVLTCFKRFKKVFFKVFENSFKIYKKIPGLLQYYIRTICYTILELFLMAILNVF